jgi:hypothetical protein
MMNSIPRRLNKIKPKDRGGAAGAAAAAVVASVAAVAAPRMESGPLP